MQRIHEPADLMEAQMLISMLRSEGIQVYLQGADLVGGMGELPALGLLGLMVEDEQVQQARALIASYQQATPIVEGEYNAPHLVRCGILEC
ncbi:MAG: DUF2007 domain-containing protein [Gammaproteobacteria bacterium]|nr:DUF2007 domain-containing protein [Gammaproteobacteria bacterium]